MARTNIKPQEIKEAVRDYYGKVAQSAATSGCCSSSSSCCASEKSALYSKTELATVPTEAATSSRGCGNPVTLANLREGEIVLDLGSGGGIDVLLAARRVGPKGFVYGLDMTDEMLELANRNAEKAGLTNVKFLKGGRSRRRLGAAGNALAVCARRSAKSRQSVHEQFSDGRTPAVSADLIGLRSCKTSVTSS